MPSVPRTNETFRDTNFARNREKGHYMDTRAHARERGRKKERTREKERQREFTRFATRRPDEKTNARTLPPFPAARQKSREGCYRGTSSLRLPSGATEFGRAYSSLFFTNHTRTRTETRAESFSAVPGSRRCASIVSHSGSRAAEDDELVGGSALVRPEVRKCGDPSLPPLHPPSPSISMGVMGEAELDQRCDYIGYSPSCECRKPRQAG